MNEANFRVGMTLGTLMTVNGLDSKFWLIKEVHLDTGTQQMREQSGDTNFRERTPSLRGLHPNARTTATRASISLTGRRPNTAIF